MKIILLILSFAIITICAANQLFSQKIYESKDTGGNWNDPATWVQGKVPQKDDEVVISANVIADDYFECKSIEINVNGEFQVSGDINRPVNIFGNLLIYGKMEIKENTKVIVKDCVKICDKSGLGLNNYGTLVVGGFGDEKCDKLKCK